MENISNNINAAESIIGGLEEKYEDFVDNASLGVMAVDRFVRRYTFADTFADLRSDLRELASLRNLNVSDIREGSAEGLKAIRTVFYDNIVSLFPTQQEVLSGLQNSEGDVENALMGVALARLKANVKKAVAKGFDLMVESVREDYDAVHDRAMINNPQYRASYNSQYEMIAKVIDNLSPEEKRVLSDLVSAVRQSAIDGLTEEIMTGFSSGGEAGAMAAMRTFVEQMTPSLREHEAG